MRINFKKQEIKASIFFKFCEENGADYFESDGDYAVWIIPKKYGEFRMGIKLEENGWVSFVTIDESCMNINGKSGGGIHAEEQEWIVKTLSVTLKYSLKGGNK